MSTIEIILFSALVCLLALVLGFLFGAALTWLLEQIGPTH